MNPFSQNNCTAQRRWVGQMTFLHAWSLLIVATTHSSSSTLRWLFVRASVSVLTFGQCLGFWRTLPTKMLVFSLVYYKMEFVILLLLASSSCFSSASSSSSSSPQSSSSLDIITNKWTEILKWQSTTLFCSAHLITTDTQFFWSKYRIIHFFFYWICSCHSQRLPCYHLRATLSAI